MIESRGGESIKGTVIDDPELIDLGRRVGEALGVRGPCTVQAFRDPEIGLGITDVNTRFGGAFPAPMYAALPGRTYPELIVRMARGERSSRTSASSAPGHTFTRWFWQIELDERLRADRPRHHPGRPASAALEREEGVRHGYLDVGRDARRVHRVARRTSRTAGSRPASPKLAAAS